MKTGKHILVVHYSLSGNTERVTEDLATRLGAEREKIGDMKDRRVECIRSRGHPPCASAPDPSVLYPVAAAA